MKARVRVKDRMNKLPEAISTTNGFDGRRVRVGYFGGETQMIAAVHEFGAVIPVTPKMRGFLAANFGVHLKKSTTVIRIPERSFLRAGWDRNRAGIQQKYKKLIGEAIMAGVPPEALLEILAQEARGKLQDYAKNLSSPPNSSLTIANKGNSNPLVDTGNMLGSMDYKIE